MSAPTTMRAWQVVRHGEPADALERREVPVPVPGAGQVLVQVSACALNFPDALLARGQYQVRPPLPFTPGIELCGTVVALGEGVPEARLGERVLGMPALPDGALADYAIVLYVALLDGGTQRGASALLPLIHIDDGKIDINANSARRGLVLMVQGRRMIVEGKTSDGLKMLRAALAALPADSDYSREMKLRLGELQRS